MFHFIGIKGSGMSALAQVMHTLGYIVQGSDVEKEFFTEIGLREKNIPIYIYNQENIKPNMEIVLGNSIKDDNPELIKARELNLKIHTYQEMINEVISKFNSIAISGCHGKTSTTALSAHVLNNIVGCNYLIGDGTGYANKDNNLFSFEACEYQRHFLAYYPNYVIITNIDLDHTDYYKDIDDIKEAFKDFSNHAKKKVIAWGNDKHIREINIDNVIYYGRDDNNDIIAKNVIYKTTGMEFDVYKDKDLLHHFDLPFYGEHTLLNTLAVITLCYLENISLAETEKHLKTFAGARRRFSEQVINDTVIIDDYAHHPTEIEVTIKAARQKYPDKKLITVFQPHTFTRTKSFMKEYIEVFNKADKAYLLDIHPAREKQEDYPEITSEIIIQNIAHGEHLEMNEGAKLLSHKGEVVLFMSANDLSVLENSFIDPLKKS